MKILDPLINHYSSSKRKAHWIFTSSDGKKWLFHKLGVYAGTFWDILRNIDGKFSGRSPWKTFLLHRRMRSPSALGMGFRNNLKAVITYRCNLECPHCYSKGLQNDMPQDMTLDDFEQMIHWAKKNKYCVIRFLGGEATIHPQFDKMLDICRAHGIKIGLPTNNIFPKSVTEKLDRETTTFISVNYNYDMLSHPQRERFNDNLEYYRQKKIPFEFSAILGLKEKDHSALIEHAVKYAPMSIRASIAIPGLSHTITIDELIADFRPVARELIRLRDECLAAGIPFYIYRPVLPCLFTEAETKKLVGKTPFAWHTRCPLGIQGDFSRTVVVNPDLSIFPCISLFIKGPRILEFSSRKGISDHYRTILSEKMSRPLRGFCTECEKHKNYFADITGAKKHSTKKSFGPDLCQGGCINYRDDMGGICHNE